MNNEICSAYPMFLNMQYIMGVLLDNYICECRRITCNSSKDITGFRKSTDKMMCLKFPSPEKPSECIVMKEFFLVYLIIV